MVIYKISYKPLDQASIIKKLEQINLRFILLIDEKDI